jgi:hypothetical protein
MEIRGCRAALLFLAFLALSGLSRAETPAQADGAEVTIKGGLQCNGMCVPNPKPEDHLMVLFAIDGSPEIAARVKKIVEEHYPEKGLDAEAAEKLQNQFVAQLKYFVSPDSTAQVPDPNKKGAREHYCHSSQPMALTGIVTEKDGRKWIKVAKV